MASTCGWPCCSTCSVGGPSLAGSEGARHEASSCCGVHGCRRRRASVRVDVLWYEGQIADIGAGIDIPDGADVIDATGQRAAARVSSTCTPTCASRARGYAETSKPVRRQPLSAATPRCSRWPTPTRSPTARWSPTMSGTAASRSAWSTCIRSAPSPSGWPGRAHRDGHDGRRRAPRVRMFSDDGSCVHDPLVMRRALEYATGLGVLIAQHAEEPRLTAGGRARGRRPRRLGIAGLARRGRGIDRRARRACWPATPAPGCTSATPPRRAPSRSSRRAKEQGISITAEVTPHHLLLDDGRLASYDGVQGQPAAARGRRRGRAAPGAGRRGHRLRGHRPRPARRPSAKRSPSRRLPPACSAWRRP